MNISTFIISLCLFSSAQASDYFWPFHTSANPSLSETAFPNEVTIFPGPFSSGWLDTITISTNQGFWDLGASGTVTATIADEGNRAIVETVEWYDGAIYGSYATVEISGATRNSESYDIEEPWPVLGNWIRHTQEFSLSGSVWTLTVTGRSMGTILGSLHVVTYRPDAVFGLYVESSSTPSGPWAEVSSRPLLLVTNQPGSLFYRVNIKPAL